MKVTRRQVVQGVGAVGLALVAGCGRGPGQAPAQQPVRVPRVGLLIGSGTPSSPGPAAIVQTLAEHGFVDGQTVALEYRSTEGDQERHPAVAAELVNLPVELIVATGPPAARAARNATRTIPIVMQYTSDPLADGMVESLARPGGNVTGVTAYALQLQQKRLEFLKETIPHLSHVGWINATGNNDLGVGTDTAWVAAERLGLRLEPREINVDGLEAAIDALFADGVGALLVNGGVGAGQPVNRVAELATRRKLPSVYEARGGAVAGGLMSYGPNVAALYRRVGDYAARILQGANPADLPVEQPREFEFVIDLKTAQALGLTIPQHVLLQATEVIQ